MNARYATEEDIPQMLVNTQAFLAATPYAEMPYKEATMTGTLRTMIAQNLCFVIDGEDGHLGGVGCLKTTCFLNDEISIAAEVFWWVKPDKRAGGVGRALFAVIQDGAIQANCDYLVMLALHDENFARVDAAYQATGFKLFEHGYMKRLK